MLLCPPSASIMLSKLYHLCFQEVYIPQSLLRLTTHPYSFKWHTYKCAVINT